MTGGCGESVPDDLIEEETYVKILTEMHLFAAMREMDKEEDVYLKTQQAILKHYNITEDQLERSHDYYFQDVHKQQERFRAIRRKLEEINKEVSEHHRHLQKKEDSLRKLSDY